jgi:preprotein translocase subunit SecG
MGLVIAIHIIICALLVIIILIQAGRGGGLVEGFSGVESMFGTKTNTFLTRTTTTLAVLFFITCIGLALLSARQSRSLMQEVKPKEKKEEVKPVEAPVEEVKPQAETVKPQASQETPKAE